MKRPASSSEGARKRPAGAVLTLLAMSAVAPRPAAAPDPPPTLPQPTRVPKGKAKAKSKAKAKAKGTLKPAQPMALNGPTVELLPPTQFAGPPPEPDRAAPARPLMPLTTPAPRTPGTNLTRWEMYKNALNAAYVLVHIEELGIYVYAPRPARLVIWFGNYCVSIANREGVLSRGVQPLTGIAITNFPGITIVFVPQGTEIGTEYWVANEANRLFYYRFAGHRLYGHNVPNFNIAYNSPFFDWRAPGTPI